MYNFVLDFYTYFMGPLLPISEVFIPLELSGGTQYNHENQGGWSKALLALFACHPKFLASAKLFAVPKVPKVPNFKKSPSILCTKDSLAHLTHI